MISAPHQVLGVRRWIKDEVGKTYDIYGEKRSAGRVLEGKHGGHIYLEDLG